MGQNNDPEERGDRQGQQGVLQDQQHSGYPVPGVNRGNNALNVPPQDGPVGGLTPPVAEAGAEAAETAQGGDPADRPLPDRPASCAGTGRA